MPYVPGAFNGSDSDSDVGVITYSVKHLSPDYKHTGEFQTMTLLDLAEEISLCTMSLETVDHEDPDDEQITQRFEVLHGEYQKVLDKTYDNSHTNDNHDINEISLVDHDAQTLARQPLTPKKKVRKWNTVEKAASASRQPHHLRNDKPATKALPLRPNAPHTIDDLYNMPWYSLTEPEKARLLVPLFQSFDPKTGRKFDNKAAPSASIPKLPDMMRARSAPAVDTTVIAESKNKPTARVGKDDTQKVQKHKGKKWSTVKVKSACNDPQTGAALSDTSTGFKVPGLAGTPKWGDQVSPELKTFEQVHDQLREQHQQEQADKLGLPADFSGADQYFLHHFMGIPYSLDAPPYVPPISDPKAVAILKQVEELAKNLITRNEATGSGRVPSYKDQVQEQQVCDNWWDPYGGCSSCTSVDAHPSSDAAGEIDGPFQHFWDAQATSIAREEIQLQQSAQVTANSPSIKLEDLPEAIRDEMYQKFLAETEANDPVVENEKPAAVSEHIPLPSPFWGEVGNWDVSQDIQKFTGQKREVDVKATQKATQKPDTKKLNSKEPDK